MAKINGLLNLIAIVGRAEIWLHSTLDELMKRFDLFADTGDLNAIPADLKSDSLCDRGDVAMGSNVMFPRRMDRFSPEQGTTLRGTVTDGR